MGPPWKGGLPTTVTTLHAAPMISEVFGKVKPYATRGVREEYPRAGTDPTSVLTRRARGGRRRPPFKRLAEDFLPSLSE